MAVQGSVAAGSGKGLQVATARPRASQLPFEQLPNLPKPVVPHIELEITREDVLAIQASLASQRKVGFFLNDKSSQTERSDILDVKSITHVLQMLIQDVAQLRKDLNFARHVLRADYESSLTDRATQLYCHVNERLGELEKQQQERVEIVRKSYRTQLSDAIQKIAGEYKAYYEELLQGKTGRHDLKIKELRETVATQEQQLQEQAQTVEQLTLRLNNYEEQKVEEDDTPPPPPPGISLEEAEELRSTIGRLEGEVSEARADIAAQEDANRRLMRQVDSLNRQLEEERGRVYQLKRELEATRKKAKADQEKASRMAQNQMAALEKEMQEKMEKAKNEAAHKLQQQAELQRLQEQARLQEEMERRRGLEVQLLSRENEQKSPPAEGDLAQLQQLERQQREEISRLRRELEKTNRVWELKLAIMQRNFHALKDECFLRHSLQRQAATLHHATVGYAVGAKGNTRPRLSMKNLKPLPGIKSTSGSSSERTQTAGSTLGTDTPISLPPPPSPLNSATRRDTQSPSRSVHFDDSHAPTPRSHDRVTHSRTAESIPTQA